MTAPPRRVQLSRAPGWLMPDNTVKVDRSTQWGNPFRVGVHGTAAECVEAYGFLAGEEADIQLLFRIDVQGLDLDRLDAALAELKANPALLRGKNLACWCPLGQPCHADVLLRAVNTPGHPFRGSE